MAKLSRQFYEQKAVDVAKGLLGRFLVCTMPGNKLLYARLTEIAAYEGETDSTSKGVNYAPGLISISTKFGQRILDLATGRENKPSCVTLRDADVGTGKKVHAADGPGNLTKLLGISKANKDLYDAEKIYGTTMWIEGKPAEASHIRRLKGNTPNCKGIFKISTPTNKEELEKLLKGYANQK